MPRNTRRKSGKQATAKKTPAKASSRKHRRRKSSRARSRSRRWLKPLLGLGMLGLLLCGGYITYLSHEVRVKFEGKRWALPARVYAQPLELYAGAAVTPRQLQDELTALGYRPVRAPRQGGQWSRNGSRWLVHTRDFLFWDGAEPARTLALHFTGNQLSALNDAATGRPLDIVRLEPREIGSIYPAQREDRVLVRRDQLPDALVNGLLAVEDRKFYHHHGIDPQGIARAMLANLRAGRTVQGGSTLTQQLAKNFFLTQERTLWRKFNEALIALILEARYQKDEILEAYANEIYLGQDGPRAIHGFGLAAHFYFSRPLRELRLPEIALLVGLVKGASYYNPRRHPARAKARRDLVLTVMVKQGMLDPKLAAQAKAAPLGVTERGKRGSASYPDFVDLVRRQLRRDYREEDLTSEGLRIFTTLDPRAQRQAERVLADQLKRLERRRDIRTGTLEGAVVLVTPQSGEVSALVGGRQAGFAGFNRALDAVRPIGSLVKPAVYLTALGNPDRYTLVTPLDDAPIQLRDERGQLWTPQNYDQTSHGTVPLYSALAHSYNQATVRLGMELGMASVIDTLRALGVERPMKPYPALLLGSLSLSPLEVAQMYQTLSAGGFRAPLRAIREVLDNSGQPLHRYPVEVVKAADPASVYLLDRNLEEVARQGTARNLASYLPGTVVAGKTGTTNGLRDSWFAGFTGDRVGVVWVGRDDNQPTGLTGSHGALPVWGRLMAALGAQPLSLTMPDGVESAWVSADTGLLSDEFCSGAVEFPFIVGSEPTSSDACRGTLGIGNVLKRWFE
jgi:penicillin-binding protein 1B